MLAWTLAAGHCPLGEMCGRYLATIQHQTPKTIERKTVIAAVLKRDFPGGADVALEKVLSSRMLSSLATYDFGPPSCKLYLEFARTVFAMTVADRPIPRLPVHDLKGKRLRDPIRTTPSFEEFLAIVVDIRTQRYNSDSKNSGDCGARYASPRTDRAGRRRADR